MESSGHLQTGRENLSMKAFTKERKRKNGLNCLVCVCLGVCKMTLTRLLGWVKIALSLNMDETEEFPIMEDWVDDGGQLKKPHGNYYWILEQRNNECIHSHSFMNGVMASNTATAAPLCPDQHSHSHPFKKIVKKSISMY